MTPKVPMKGLRREFPAQAEAVADILRTNKEGLMARHPELFRGFYNPPKTGHARMLVINAILGGHGVEAVHRDDGGLFGQGSVAFEYINTGDTYSPTVVRYPGGIYRVSSWGDEVEKLERKGVAVK